MNQYRSNYPNHVHLMHVVASKHLYFLADGRLKYQGKAIENDLANVAESSKNVVVHMVVTDHTSGAMYGESYSCRDTLDPVGFLRRAWNQKEHSFFCGVPELLSIAKTTETIWPEIRAYATIQGTQVVNPTSGFHGGAKHPVHWEKELSAWGFSVIDPSIKISHHSCAIGKRIATTSTTNDANVGLLKSRIVRQRDTPKTKRPF